MPLSKAQQKGLGRIAQQEMKERRSRFRHLTYSPGEKIWIGVTILFLIAMPFLLS